MNKIANIYRIAKKCGFDAKHREEAEKTVFAFKSNESALNCFFEIAVPNDDSEKTFCDNVAHGVFLFSENIDPQTETQKYIEKIGGTLQQYVAIYSQMNALSWQIRKFWLSL